MKYCPYCGAALPDAAVSFCGECGNSLPSQKERSEPNTEKTKQKQQKKKPAHSHKKVYRPLHSPPPDNSHEVMDDYDGYYDDILPMDEDRQREGLDSLILHKIIILLCGLAVVIGLCVALMYLL